MNLRRVVVTGLGAITPIGNNVSEYWDNLLKGVSGAGLITLFDASKFKTQFACEVKGYNPEEFFDHKEARKLDRYVQFAMVVAKEAIENSAIQLDSIDLDRAGVIFASGIGGIMSYERDIADFLQNPDMPRFNPFFITRMIANMAAGHISMQYSFRGPNFGVVSACASSTHAISLACDQIRLGRADIMITGGAEAPISTSGIGGFNAMRALSTRNDEYQTASRPLSGSRDGFVLGEGAGCLILEDYDHAIKRGAHIYAEVAGVAASADAYHMTATHPDGLGAMLVMRNALKDAGLTVDDIDYINIHGTSTPNGDPSEIKAIQGVFGESAKKLNISSTKSMTGHLMGATGAIEAIASILSIVHNEVPPTINHKEDDVDPNIDYSLNYTFNVSQKRLVRAAMSNTFGFGGHNATIIFKKFEG
ncbi:MAG: beta-ketoacyl-ACP synthase II [Paludibacteraceae bacterium]|nr:beta-ketoacyl-ACP synthase II [Paludibacteraceae bacterium]